jgi:hypothetical protein
MPALFLHAGGQGRRHRAQGDGRRCRRPRLRGAFDPIEQIGDARLERIRLAPDLDPTVDPTL